MSGPLSSLPGSWGVLLGQCRQVEVQSSGTVQSPLVPHRPATSLSLSPPTQRTPNTCLFLALSKLPFVSALDIESAHIFQRHPRPFPLEQFLSECRLSRTETGSRGASSQIQIHSPTRTQRDLRRKNSTRTKHELLSPRIILQQQHSPFLPALQLPPPPLQTQGSTPRPGSSQKPFFISWGESLL